MAYDGYGVAVNIEDHDLDFLIKKAREAIEKHLEELDGQEKREEVRSTEEER